MKRTVKINKVGIRGVGLVVEFSEHPPVACLDIKTDCASFSPGYAEHQDGVFCTVWSKAFKNTAEAELWLSELTKEMKGLAEITGATIASFKSLESTMDV